MTLMQFLLYSSWRRFFLPFNFKVDPNWNNYILYDCSHYTSIWFLVFFSVRVRDKCHSFLFTVKWPNLLLDLSTSYKKVLPTNVVHWESYPWKFPKMVDIKQSLKYIRLRNKDSIESTTQISLFSRFKHTSLKNSFSMAWIYHVSTVYKTLRTLKFVMMQTKIILCSISGK